MAKDPAFLFYSNDFMSGTQFFTHEQTGKYIRMLCAQHQHGHLSQEQVLMICGTLDKQVLEKFEQDPTGKFFNERLDIEIERRKKFCESRRQNKLSKKTHDKHVETVTETKTITNTEKEEKGVQGENESTAFREFKIFLSEEAPKLLKVKQPFTELQFEKINGIYPRSEIESLCREMQNYEPFLKKYTSAYLTFMSWMGRRTKTNDTVTNKNNREPVSDIRATLFKNRFPGNSDGGSYSQVG